MREFTGDLKTQIDSGKVKTVWLLHLGFDAPLFYTDAGFNVKDTNDTYLFSRDVVGFDDLAKRAELSNEKVTITFALNSPIYALSAQGSFLNTPVYLYRGWLDDNNQLAKKVLHEQGVIVSFGDDDSENVFTIEVGNMFSSFRAINSWRTTPESHKRRYENDECMKYAAKASETILWGGELSGGKRANSGTQEQTLKGR